mgnify:CR=1 FL=1
MAAASSELGLLFTVLALVSGMIVQRESALEVVARCRSAGLVVIAGGPLFASEEEYEELSEMDERSRGPSKG